MTGDASNLTPEKWKVAGSIPALATTHDQHERGSAVIMNSGRCSDPGSDSPDEPTEPRILRWLAAIHEADTEPPETPKAAPPAEAGGAAAGQA